MDQRYTNQIMFASIIEMLSGLFKAVPFFNKWFTKTAQQKIDNRVEDTHESVTKTKKTGRPH